MDGNAQRPTVDDAEPRVSKWDKKCPDCGGACEQNEHGYIWCTQCDWWRMR